MEQLFIFILILVTSAAAYWAGSKGPGLSSGPLRTAIGRMLESIGFIVVFFAVNLAVAVVIILAIRTLTPWFVSIYLADDVVLLVLSLLQGIAFQWWRSEQHDH
jgi:hypothetical protein